jgi:putative ABC transport system permease protein
MEAMRERALRTQLSPVVVGGVVGLFLIAMVALGLTGVLWQNVTRRTREIGVRRAIGASGVAVYRQMVLEVMLLAGIALAAGLIVVVQLPILGALSFVTPAAFSAGTTAAVATVLLLTAFCALYPSWMASRLQPADALRYE